MPTYSDGKGLAVSTKSADALADVGARRGSVPALARRRADRLTPARGAPSIGAWFAASAWLRLPGWGPRRRDAQPYRSRALDDQPDPL